MERQTRDIPSFAVENYHENKCQTPPSSFQLKYHAPHSTNGKGNSQGLTPPAQLSSAPAHIRVEHQVRSPSPSPAQSQSSCQAKTRGPIAINNNMQSVSGVARLLERVFSGAWAKGWACLSCPALPLLTSPVGLPRLPRCLPARPPACPASSSLTTAGRGLAWQCGACVLRPRAVPDLI
ncbi:hypothetical protein MPTK1_4g15840 [Marchantia polymorpha subsp. ruderalis]|uniref:Uncharacterized protein n=2 Tax=Marchantia polymorpha TaxID=3197 RepID=A0AAF6BAB6_MARPO|nr:hypothetical protein MARPO_0054s0049 [Marchantia polymorpha]BBN08950.1 hypothetical protein Mp_4g15840 [Marchantia polymorpha subsp. ruderalis]|eukprot:PTQ37936.1 hypothetical protein MARPO_0054s0049 [Marchantia polymorpha]